MRKPEQLGKMEPQNAVSAPDYGSMGHAEVVCLKIPLSSFPEFAKEYLDLLDKEGNRLDKFFDKGRKCRNLVGVPGGTVCRLGHIPNKQLIQLSHIKMATKSNSPKGLAVIGTRTERAAMRIFYI